jgi:mRNA-degrading endonuclease toxin of MazEF toxin-antitoxin module
MRGGMMYREGGVVPGCMEYSELVAGKARPALIVSNDAYNASVEEVVVCGISSKRRLRPYSVAVRPADMREGSLHRAGRIRADVIIRLHKSFIRARFGAIRQETLAQAQAQIAKLVGLQQNAANLATA